MIDIKENQYGNLDIRINEREYLNVPSSKPKKMIVADSGKGYCEGQYYVILGFEWTEKDREYYHYIVNEFNEEELRFDDIETLFSFLNVYLNRFEWGYGK